MKYLKISQYLMISMHVAGAIGLMLDPTRSLFLSLVPFHLIITAILVVLYQRKQSYFMVMASCICLLGYGVEVVGVKTGVIFGHYHYGSTLGFALLGVPLLIGINWFVLIMATGSVVQHINNVWVRAAFGALLMVMLDYLIEPVAVALNFWSWDDKTIPAQNYLAWGLISFVFHLGYAFFDKSHNSISKTVFYCQLAFFAVLNTWIFIVLST